MPVGLCLEIYSGLEKWAVQYVLVREAALPVVVLQVTPTDLRPDIAGQLKFQSALYLVAPVGAIHRFSHNGSPLPVQFKCSVRVGVESTDIAFRKKLRGFPDFHLPAETDHRIDPIDRICEVQTLSDSQ